MSKGSKRRPSQVPDRQVQENWDRIYGTTKVKEPPPLPYKTHEWTTDKVKDANRDSVKNKGKDKSR